MRSLIFLAIVLIYALSVVAQTKPNPSMDWIADINAQITTLNGNFRFWQSASTGVSLFYFHLLLVSAEEIPENEVF